MKTSNHHLVAGRDKLMPLIQNLAFSDADMAIGLTLKILL
jgi:hypothetical protein